MSISVGDFAQGLLEQELYKSNSGQSAPTFESDPSFYNPQATAQVDISHVEVPTNFVTNLVEQKDVVAEMKLPTSVEESSQETQSLDTSELQDLISEVKTLLKEVKSTLVEMTACGALGVNLAGPQKDAGAGIKKKKSDDEDKLAKILKRIRKNKEASF